ncbi:hypothetical protein MNBD_NITROSPINAE02-10 [hydrothermal vent metagenome]|uniref:Glycosyl transferase family 1 domain-containing protein n=1 Tax=hydrothermal vent metagenome TaxID=652676 RepID=A0A3B1CSP5_9ZZZZ
MNTNRPSVAIILSEPDYRLTDAYISIFTDLGWDARVEKPAGSFDNDKLVIAGFDVADNNRGLVESLPTNGMAIDFHYREDYETSFSQRPFHYLDSATIIIHDLEAKRFIKEKVRPVDSRLVLLPYPCGEAQGARTAKKGAPKIFTSALFENHQWLEGLDVTCLRENYPAEVGAGSLVVILKYDPAVWPLIQWALATGLPIVAPGITAFERTIFYCALLFDPASKEDFLLKLSVLRRPGPKRATKEKLKIGVVVPRYIKGAAGGGAETHAAHLAKSLNEAGHNATIITTRTSSMGDWNNDLPAGETCDNGMTIIRFALDNLDPSDHHKLGHRINMRDNLSWSEETRWMRSGIRSTPLDRYIGDKADEYDYFFFIPYLYGTTYWGSHMAPEKSWLIPCYHNEAVAYMRPLRQNAQWMAGICFNTVAEKRLAEKTLKIKNKAMLITGEGVETGAKGDAKRFRAKYGIEGDFVLYVGRFQPEKNIPALVEDFKKYASGSKAPMKLCFIGKGDMKLKDDPAHGIRVLGFLPEQDKIDAYAASTAFILPSLKESFSIVMMEAWIQGKPVIAHGMCNVAREHMFLCGGGYLYRDADELADGLDKIGSDKALAEKMGNRGREYVLENFEWEKIVDRLVKRLRKTELKPIWERLGQEAKGALENLNKGGDEAFIRWAGSCATGAGEIFLSSELPLPELVEKHEDNADISTKYREFSHRAVFGALLSRLREVMTRHIRTNYIEQFESKQNIYNKETARLIQKLYEEIDKLS